MKTIVVLGGAGDMGSRIVRELIASKEVNVIIADFREDKAKQLLEEFNDKERHSTIFVDANNHHLLKEVIANGDVVVNAIGPFYRYARKIASAAIEVGIPYIDICDDDDAMVEILSLDRYAIRKGVTVITGVGWTPGISNILAKKGTMLLDEVHDIDMTWVGGTADSEGVAVISHVLHAINRDTPMYLDGQWQNVPALSGVEEVEFPEPIGKVKAYYVGHPEPITLPQYIDGVRNVRLRGYLLPDEMQNITKLMIDLDLVNSNQKIQSLSVAIQPLLPMFSMIGKKKTLPLSAIRVDVTGIKDNSFKHYGWTAIDSMERLTGIPPAVTALMVARGEIKAAGVFPAEGVIEPDSFIAELAKRDIEIEEIQEGKNG